MGANKPRILAVLSILQILNDRRSLERVLEPIGQGIKASGSILEDAEVERLDDRYLDSIISEETWIIENLLGAAFVTCHTHITKVTSTISRLYYLCDEKTKNQFEFISNRNYDVYKKNSPLMSGTSFTKIEVIQVAANYFKHKSEWAADKNEPRKWKECKTGKHTIEAMNDLSDVIDISAGSTGNLRALSRALGNTEYSDTSVFIDIIADWQVSLEKSVRDELSGTGIL
ncbi:hypothetical protein KA005_74850 [bacterium]|nr:hypothetical protein [bacterium]